ncbi:MAG: prealbumin-like fold domain-containing protein, partial [Clostridiales bacterium]|nr:prealbumin-like fold domain-containing protein [Clostridiales bacterium]
KDGAEDTWTTVKEFTVDETTTSFTFSGLDDGNYRLTETVTPAGYNTIDPIEFTVNAEHDVLSDNPALTSLSGNATNGELTFTSNTTEGSLSADVVNNAGSTLPETGGIGTTIFYVLGGVLVLAAVVLLVTKKRMSGAEK